jgi:hypothetical protein
MSAGDWNANSTYFPGDTVNYSASVWLCKDPSRGQQPDLYPSVWTNQGGGGGGSGVQTFAIQGFGLTNLGTATNVLLQNTGVATLNTDTPELLDVIADLSYNYTITSFAQLPLTAGYGIGISGDVISNTGVAGLVGGTNATVTGPDASFNYTITNTATGTLTQGTGIQIAGDVISNTGVISISSADNSTTATALGGGSWRVSANTTQVAKYITGLVNGNVNVPNNSQFTRIATITVPPVTSTGGATYYMTSEYAGIAFSCLTSMFGPTGGGNMVVRLYADNITPSPAGIYPISGVPTNYCYFAFGIADSRTLPVAINFLMTAGEGSAGSYTQYTSSTRQFNLEAAILNVSGSQSATWNPSGTASYQLVGIN